jgi:hypothetical protein
MILECLSAISRWRTATTHNEHGNSGSLTWVVIVTICLGISDKELKCALIKSSKGKLPRCEDEFLVCSCDMHAVAMTIIPPPDRPIRIARTSSFQISTTLQAVRHPNILHDQLDILQLDFLFIRFCIRVWNYFYIKVSVFIDSIHSVYKTNQQTKENDCNIHCPRRQKLPSFHTTSIGSRDCLKRWYNRVPNFHNDACGKVRADH